MEGQAALSAASDVAQRRLTLEEIKLINSWHAKCLEYQLCHHCASTSGRRFRNMFVAANFLLPSAAAFFIRQTDKIPYAAAISVVFCVLGDIILAIRCSLNLTSEMHNHHMYMQKWRNLDQDILGMFSYAEATQIRHKLNEYRSLMNANIIGAPLIPNHVYSSCARRIDELRQIQRKPSTEALPGEYAGRNSEKTLRPFSNEAKEKLRDRLAQCRKNRLKDITSAQSAACKETWLVSLLAVASLVAALTGFSVLILESVAAGKPVDMPRFDALHYWLKTVASLSGCAVSGFAVLEASMQYATKYQELSDLSVLWSMEGRHVEEALALETMEDPDATFRYIESRFAALTARICNQDPSFDDIGDTEPQPEESRALLAVDEYEESDKD